MKQNQFEVFLNKITDPFSMVAGKIPTICFANSSTAWFSYPGVQMVSLNKDPVFFKYSFTLKSSLWATNNKQDLL